MTKQYYLVNHKARAAQSLIAATLGGLLVGLLHYMPQLKAETPARPTTHITIPAPLFDIAEEVCKNNGGYDSVAVHRRSDVFTFRCMDGLSLRDTVVRVK